MSTEARTIRQYAELIRAGHSVDLNTGQFSNRTAGDLEHLLKVTREAGGPIAKTLDRFASVLNAREQAQRELELAVAGPKASSRLVMALPLLVFIGSGISGIPIFRTLTTSPIVWVSLLIGGGMFWLGSRWTNQILRKAEPEIEDPGLALDALGIGLQAGMPIKTASEIAGLAEIGDLESLSQGSGVAMSQLVTDRADSLRLQQFNSDRMRIQKASVAVLWPLGLTVLPAFVLIAIIPVGFSLVQSQ